jgi:hypothetical protein
MSGIRWTEEQPTEEGWYWIRMKNGWVDDKTDCIGYVFRSQFGRMEMMIPMYEYAEPTTEASHFAKVQ